MKKGTHCGCPLFTSLARPQRFKLPTFRFVGRPGIFKWFQINELDGPPSPNFAPKLAKSRRAMNQPYDGGSTHGNTAPDNGLCSRRRAAIPGDVD